MDDVGSDHVAKILPQHNIKMCQFSHSAVFDCLQPHVAACQASLSITNSRSLPKRISIESEMPSSHFILCHPLLLLPPTPPSIRVFSNESVFHIRWPKNSLLQKGRRKSVMVGNSPHLKATCDHTRTQQYWPPTC